MKFSFLFLIFIYQIGLTQTMGKSLQSARLEKTKDVLSLKFTPNKGHHYNLDAPTNVSKSGQKQIPTSLTPSHLLFTVSAHGKCDYVIQTYVCDDKKTFCAPQKMTVTCEDIKKLSTQPEFSSKGMIDVSNLSKEKNITTADINTTKEKKSSHKEIFIVNDPKMAFDQAKKTGKPLFIEFFGVWCPPCNILDETVFNSPRFASTAKNMILLKLDADEKVSWDLKSKYSVGGYPTVVLATPEGQEISRFVGSLPELQIIKIMKYAIQNKNTSLAQKMEQYQIKATPKSALEIVESLVANDKFADTLPYIPEALKESKLTITQKEMLSVLPILVVSKTKSEEPNKALIPYAKTLFESYTVTDLYIQKHDLMKSIAQAAKDEAFAKWVQETHIKNLQKALTDPKWEANLLTRVDLMYLLTSAYEELGQNEDLKKVHADIAKEYSRLISLHKQNPKTNRGYNLERIYSIYKSGAVNEARSEYEKLIDVYPHEFAFHYNYASVLKDLKNWDEALKYAQNSLTYSYGDNQLRSVYLVADLEFRKGLTKEPLERITKAIESTELPKDETVRTHRYIKRLAELKKSIQDGKVLN